MKRVYHVAKGGHDQNPGTKSAPFLTIQRAADLAQAGDRVVVHGGVYREWVRPRNGGWNEDSRIVYEAAEGEHPIIKGSEQITGWMSVEGTVWKVELDNGFFGGFNPYAVPLGGDWFVGPLDYAVHPGEVYQNGKSFYEARSLEEVFHPAIRTVSPHETWDGREEKILEPERTLYQWFCEAGRDTTVIYANFQGADPNQELVEINVRKFCFFPERTGVNYITVRGFEMAQAAAGWAPPTAMQEGLIGPNWSRGWIIENNVIHDAKCSGISIGKEADDPVVRVTEDGGTVWLELELPESFPLRETAVICSQVLRTPRIVGQRFEQPDGSSIRLDRDMTGAERPARPVAGPVEHMRPGINKIPVWEQPGIRNNADGKMEIYE